MIVNGIIFGANQFIVFLYSNVDINFSLLKKKVLVVNAGLEKGTIYTRL